MKRMDFPFTSIDTITFRPRPQPLPANLRPVYRIALIVLVLHLNCRNASASLFKLQFFNWLLKNPSLREAVEGQLGDKTVFSLEFIHLDPMVNLALKYALADKLVSLTTTSKYQLAARGHELAERILHDEQGVLAQETSTLRRIGQRISEVKLRGRLL